MKKIISVLLVFMLTVTLTACGKSTHAGTYKLVSVGGEEVVYNNENSPFGALVDAAYELVLNKDGTGSMNILGFETKLTWDSKSITIQGETMPLSFSGNKLQIGTDKDTVMVFKKK